ncbi:MAG TPA: hypothetical protein VK066_12130 [Chloroflexota bacterium]|nr:hypothetical protein [Chloroflexota bacterium]
MADTDLAGISEIVARLRREIEQARFAGDDPTLSVAPADPPLLIVAKTLAAERLNAGLRVNDAVIALQEDVAEDLFYRGLSALRYWRFAGAQAAFQEAGAKTADAARQQRLTFYRAATALVRRIVLSDPEQPPRAVPEERALGLVDTLDALPTAERAHYAAELRRLIALRQALPGDPYLQTVHCLLRARLALGGGDDTVGLGWLLRAAALQGTGPAPSPYLADLLERARRRLRRFLGEADGAPPDLPKAGKEGDAPGGASAPDGAAPERAEETSDDVRAAALLEALGNHLDQALGREVLRDAAQFGIAPYHEE